MEETGAKGWINGAFFLLATDNKVSKRAFYKGNTISKKLFGLVLRLKELQLCYGCRIIATHESGSIMIHQGTDSISGGEMEKGVSIGQQMLEHCPWGKDALTASPSLIDELRSWLEQILTRLQPRDWFDLGHDVQAWRLGSNGLKHPFVH